MLDLETVQTNEPRRRRGGKLIYLLPVVTLLFVLSSIRLPYFVLRPGPAKDVETLIHISHHQTFPSRGHMLLTSVSYYRPNAYQAFGAWLDPAESVVPVRVMVNVPSPPPSIASAAVAEIDKTSGSR